MYQNYFVPRGSSVCEVTSKIAIKIYIMNFNIAFSLLVVYNRVFPILVLNLAELDELAQ